MRVMNVISVVPLVLAGLSCGETAPLTAPDAYLTATISGAVADSHDGHAYFASRFHDRMQKNLFDVSSHDVNAEAKGQGDRWIYLMAIGYLELPGEVALTNVDPDTPGTTGFTVLYFRDGKRYVSADGRLTPERVSDDVVEASFWFDAFRYGADCEAGARCPVPVEPPADAEWISVRGSFVATPPPVPELLDR